MASHNEFQGNAEGVVDIGFGIILSILTSIGELAEPFIVGALGAVGSITIRVVYKRYFKKYFENKSKENDKTSEN